MYVSHPSPKKPPKQITSIVEPSVGVFATGEDADAVLPQRKMNVAA
jgi:hypothetical protein